MSDAAKDTPARKQPRKVFVGERYGSLVVLAISPGGKRSIATRCVCACDCGRQHETRTKSLSGGRTHSCGCARARRARGRSPRRMGGRIGRPPVHGLSKSPEYTAWHQAKHRCGNPNNPAFKHYGGRGISVCQRWRESFQAFVADMGRRPPGTSLDRIDNDGNYEPGNCRWATNAEQQTNTRQNIRCELPSGEIITQNELSRRLGVNRRTVWRHRRIGDFEAWLAEML